MQTRSSKYFSLPVLAGICAALLLILYASALGLNRVGAAMLFPKTDSDVNPDVAHAAFLRDLLRRGYVLEEAQLHAQYQRSFAPELSPLLQIREREKHPVFARAYLRWIAARHPDRRFVLLLGASEAGHHGCNTKHCVTRDLARSLPPPWTPVNLTRRGQSFCETAGQLDEFTKDLDPERVAVVMTINPVFFARPGGLFPEQTRGDTPPTAAGGALLADPDRRSTESDSFAAKFEVALDDWFGTAFFRRAVFRHRLGVSPAGPYQTNWIGPVAPALLPTANLESLRKIKLRPIGWSYYTFPGHGPTPGRSWRAYLAAGRIDLDFAGRRMLDLDVNRSARCLAKIRETVQRVSFPVLLLRTPLNPGMLRLLDERDGSDRFQSTYRRYRQSWRPFETGDLPLADLELDESDFVDLDHLAPSGQARMAGAILEHLFPGTDPPPTL